MAEFKASHKYCRMSARKIRPVIDLIRGESVDRALEVLRFNQKRGAFFIRKVLESALANAEYAITEKSDEYGNLELGDLQVKQAYVNDGPTFKRWRPRARGMATPILKRMSHIHVVVGTD